MISKSTMQRRHAIVYAYGVDYDEIAEHIISDLDPIEDEDED